MICKRDKAIEVLTNKINASGWGCDVFCFQTDGVRYEIAYGYKHGTFSCWIDNWCNHGIYNKSSKHFKIPMNGFSSSATKNNIVKLMKDMNIYNNKLFCIEDD